MSATVCPLLQNIGTTVLQLSDHKAYRVCSHHSRMGSHLTKLVPVQSYNTFLDQRSRKVIVQFHSMRTLSQWPVCLVHASQFDCRSEGDEHSEMKDKDVEHLSDDYREEENQSDTDDEKDRDVMLKERGMLHKLQFDFSRLRSCLRGLFLSDT